MTLRTESEFQTWFDAKLYSEQFQDMQEVLEPMREAELHDLAIRLACHLEGVPPESLHRKKILEAMEVLGIRGVGDE